MEKDNLVIVGDLYSGKIECYDVNNQALVKTITNFHTERILFLKFLPNGNVVSCSNDKTVNVWETRMFTSLQRYTGHSNWVNGVDQIDGDIMVSVSLDKTIQIWSISTGQTLKSINANIPVWSVRVLPRGTSIVCGTNGSDDNLRIYDFVSGSLKQTLRAHDNDVRSIDILSEQCIVSGGDDMKVFIWDLITFKVKYTLMGNIGKVACVKRLSSTQMASCSYGTIIIWNWQTGSRLNTFYGHIVALLYSALDSINDETLISCSEFKTLKVWNVSSGQSTKSLITEMHIGAVAIAPRLK